MADILYKHPDYVFSYRVSGLLIRDNKVLLHKPAADEDGWAIPGGHVAALETNAETLRREFMEELHAPIRVDHLLASAEVFFPWGNKPCHQICMYYAATLEDETAIPLDGIFHGYDDMGNERINLDFRWVPLEELDRITVYPPQIVEVIRSDKEHPVHFVYQEEARVILETERLILREMTQADLPALKMIHQDPLCMTAYEGPFTDEEVQRWLDNQLRRYREDGFGLWAMVRKETGEMIGQCGLTWQNADGQKVLEIGYLQQRRYWGQGYATEAAIACREYAFHHLGASEVYSIIRDTNQASQAVARRNGMIPCATFVKHYRGVDMPHILFRATKA